MLSPGYTGDGHVGEPRTRTLTCSRHRRGALVQDLEGWTSCLLLYPAHPPGESSDPTKPETTVVKSAAEVMRGSDDLHPLKPREESPDTLQQDNHLHEMPRL